MRPLLAATLTEETFKTLRFPVWGSPKIDGIRALTIRGGVLSRSMKPIPNAYVQLMLSHHDAMYLDGELTVGRPTGSDCFNRTTSAVMSHSGVISDLTFHVFDWFKDPHMAYGDRFREALTTVEHLNNMGHRYVRLLHPQPLENIEMLEAYENEQVSLGYEGIMIRDPRAGYKFNRSTLREQIMLKLKRFEDAEGVVIGWAELMSNQNIPATSETGYQVRSSHKEGLVPMGVLGALIVDWNGTHLKIGTGFGAQDRKDLWADRGQLVNRIVKFKYQKYGMKDLPRLPVFVGFRSEFDV
jgi:DNA ligase 1